MPPLPTITCRGFLSFTIFTGRFCRCTGGTGNIFTIGAILHLCMARRRAAFGAADGSRSGNCDPRDVLALTREYGISARLTFSNSLLRPEHLADRGCNRLCRLFAGSAGPQNGVIVHSELLLEHLRSVYPELYLVSSTTKVLTDFAALRQELERPEFRCVVPDFRLNRAFDRLDTLPRALRDKVEFLCNECCDFGCRERRACYEAVSRENLGEGSRFTAAHPRTPPEAIAFPGPWRIPASSGWTTSGARICPRAFPNSRSKGRSLGSALLLEFLLHYLTRPPYHIHVREALYLDNGLDLF